MTFNLKTLLFISLFVLTGITNPIFSQQSVLDFDLVPKDLLEKWVEDYGFSNLDALAEKGSPIAQRRLGRYYSFYKNDSQTAVKWYKKAAQSGDYWAQCNLAAQYFNGGAVPIDIDKALEWYVIAMKNEPYGSTSAFLGMRSIKGWDWANEQYGKWYLEDALNGNAKSQDGLALMYQMGSGGFPKDMSLAKKWYKKAADQGFKPSIAALIDIENEELINAEEIVKVEDVEITQVKESDLYGVWKVKELVSKIDTIENIDYIIDKEEYKPLRYALSKAKFVINADKNFTMFISYSKFGDYFLDVRWSLDKSKIIIVDKPGGELEDEGILLEIEVEQSGDETIFIMMDGLFYLYVEKR